MSRIGTRDILVMDFRRMPSVKATSSGSAAIHQAAAIAVRGRRICLITSTNNRGWGIPKGHIEPGQTIREAALQEAWEEAGLRGKVMKSPLGAYFYEKNNARYHVTLFLMRVSKVADFWPEDHRRVRRWVNADAAAQLVHDSGLKKLLSRLTGLKLILD